MKSRRFCDIVSFPERKSTKATYPCVAAKTYSLFSNVPEYLNVLGPSAKVKAKGPDTSQSFALGQKTVYVVAALSYTQHC